MIFKLFFSQRYGRRGIFQHAPSHRTQLMDDVGDKHIRNHVEPMGLTLHAETRDPPSLREAKGTHSSRGSTGPLLTLIPCQIIRKNQQHRYLFQLVNYHLHNPSSVRFYHKKLGISWNGARIFKLFFSHKSD